MANSPDFNPFSPSYPPVFSDIFPEVLPEQPPAEVELRTPTMTVEEPESGVRHVTEMFFENRSEQPPADVEPRTTMVALEMLESGTGDVVNPSMSFSQEMTRTQDVDSSGKSTLVVSAASLAGNEAKQKAKKAGLGPAEQDRAYRKAYKIEYQKTHPKSQTVRAQKVYNESAHFVSKVARQLAKIAGRDDEAQMNSYIRTYRQFVRGSK